MLLSFFSVLIIFQCISYLIYPTCWIPFFRLLNRLISLSCDPLLEIKFHFVFDRFHPVIKSVTVRAEGCEVCLCQNTQESILESSELTVPPHPKNRTGQSNQKGCFCACFIFQVKHSDGFGTADKKLLLEVHTCHFPESILVF